MISATIIVPTLVGGDGLDALLRSLTEQTVDHQTIVVDNASPDPGVRTIPERFDGVEVLTLDRNEGFSRAVNLAAARADGDSLVLLNDDCVCDPPFVEAISDALEPSAGVAMAAGVMRDHHDPEMIDTAGVEIDRTLLPFDYLHGRPLAVLDDGVPDPVGPSGTAAAFDRALFIECGGFDEHLFAYLEDVDLALRLRLTGARCVLAPGALGIHRHSATLGPGSRRKNYLMGFGRGYTLRKWGVVTPGRLLSVIARDAVICLGQAVVDRNLGGTSGRINGWRAARKLDPCPAAAWTGAAMAGSGMGRRWQRRARRRRADRRRSQR